MGWDGIFCILYIEVLWQRHSLYYYWEITERLLSVNLVLLEIQYRGWKGTRFVKTGRGEERHESNLYNFISPD
jgi:hypothetical protein